MKNIDCTGREIQSSTFLYRLKMAMQIGYGILFPSEPWQPSQWFKNVGPVTVTASPTISNAIVFHVPVKLDHIHLDRLNDVSILLDGRATICLHNYVCPFYRTSGDRDE